MAVEIGFRQADDDSLVLAGEVFHLPVRVVGFLRAPVYRAVGHEAITVATTAIGITQALLETKRPDRAIFTLETAQIRHLYHQGCQNTLSTTVGHADEIGDVFTIEGYENIANFRAIRTGGTSGVLNVTLEKEE